MLSMGYSNNTNWNPHNGISGYEGTSFFHAGTNGYIGIGSEGDWTVSGGSGTHVAGYNLHFIGKNNGTNGHAAFFDNHVNATNNGAGFLFRNLYGNHSWGIVSEIRIEASGGTDRPSLLFSTGYNTDTWSVGFGSTDSNFRIKYDHGHRNNGWGTTAVEVDRSSNMWAYGSMRSPIFYDYNDTNYYCDPNGSSRLNDVFPNQIYNYGWFRNQSSATGLYNTATDSHFYSAGPNYWHINPDNGSVSAGGLIFYDQYNSTQGGETGRRGYVYWDGSGFGLVNGADGDWAVSVHTTNHKRVTIGGNQSLNAYGSKDGIRLMFGGGNDDAAGNYYIGTNFENYGGSYTKLDLRWHTGIRMGAQPGYGGIRFYDNEDLGTVRFSINKGDEHTRVESGSFYSNLMYDRDNTAYYVDPASTSRLLKLRVNTANDPSDNVFGTAADIPLLVAGSTRTQSTFLIENFSNSSLEYPTIVLRRTLPAAANRFGSLLRFADKDTNNNEISAQIYTFNRLTYQDLTVESGGTNDRVILRAGASSNIIVGENYVTHIKAANYSVTTPGALDIDCRQGNYFTKTIAGDSTFTFSNVTSLSGYTLAYSFTLELTHTSGTVTWPASVKWPGNTAPSLTTGKTHLFMFVTDDAGSRWRGSYLTNYDN
jgi:hypothetical protein